MFQQQLKPRTGFQTITYKSLNTKEYLTQNSLMKKNFFKKNLTYGTSVNPENIKVNDNVFPLNTNLYSSFSPNPVTDYSSNVNVKSSLNFNFHEKKANESPPATRQQKRSPLQQGMVTIDKKQFTKNNHLRASAQPPSPDIISKPLSP